MERDKHLREITNALAILSRKVEINASLNLTDLNVNAENFFRDLLNLAFGYSFININSINPNATAIDLGDEKAKIAIQVTSTSGIQKTRETVRKFIEKEYFKKYDRLIILNLVKVTKHQESKIGDAEVFELDTKDDIWDYNIFARKIQDKTTDLLKVLADFLNKELKIPELDRFIPKEIRTIISLIDYLSNHDSSDSDELFIEEPDPDGKIYSRFEEHSEFLTDRYVELYAIYGANLNAINDNLDIGITSIRKKSMYLKTYSDKVLTECNGDPKLALAKLTHEFSKEITLDGIEYDETAITFFLVNELIKCNVFPNKSK